MIAKHRNFASSESRKSDSTAGAMSSSVAAIIAKRTGNADGFGVLDGRSLASVAIGEPPALLDDEALRAPLQEQDDEQEDARLRDARARVVLDEGVRHAERDRREDRAAQLARGRRR